ncbi:MAG: tRNA pseudouridine(55) synthase TruB [Chloroflexi bacterium]|nr:tRNA pseudouridine(55) synthase TruB [Chloroflexota bacterium]
MEGVLNIDKSGGLTSHDVVNRIRRAASIRKVGHAGTLDPLATGVLLLCLGRATRLVEYLVGQPKIYEATIRLGQTTDTYDAEGEIVAERPLTFPDADLSPTFARFRGEIEQVPPMYSALKRGGQPLYKLARQGIMVERPPRTVTIYGLELLNYHSPNLTIRVACSSGTYIRSLAYDLGEALGCGGHITALRRTAVGEFTLETAVPLNQLTPESLSDALQPLETAVAHLPRLILPPEAANRLYLGQTIPREDHHPQAELVQVFTETGLFVGLVCPRADRWQPKKIFHPSTG